MAPVFISEPPAIYLTRPGLVIDAGILCACLFDEAGSDEAAARMRGRNLHAPALIDSEVCELALCKVRAGVLTLEHARHALSGLSSLALERHDPLQAEVAKIASDYGLSAFAASYVWLAGAIKAPLSTFDQDLAEAATDHFDKLSSL